MKKKIIIITGISNLIGKEFMRYYSYDDSNIVIGIWHTHECRYGFKNSREVQIDLLMNQQIVAKLTPILSEITWANIERCIFIHSAGKAKNDELGIHTIIDNNGDGLDDEMYAAQVTTFTNLHEFLVGFLTKAGVFSSLHITLVGFGSLIDKRFEPSPIHRSIRGVNNITRKIFHELSRQYSNYAPLIFTVSTVATEKEKEYRKHADQTYWLLPSELVDKAMKYIDDTQLGYRDKHIYKTHPLFEFYYKNETTDQLVERYKREIGITN